MNKVYDNEHEIYYAVVVLHKRYVKWEMKSDQDDVLQLTHIKCCTAVQ